MYQLIYTSQATVPFTDDTLTALLKWSRQWNEQVGITGVLLYNDEHFVQVLEGSVAAVGDLYGKLLRDTRHHSVMRLASGHIAARRFGNWTMSFHTVQPVHMAHIRGYCPPEHLDLHSQNPSASDELLLQIIEGFMHDSARRP